MKQYGFCLHQVDPLNTERYTAIPHEEGKFWDVYDIAGTWRCSVNVPQDISPEELLRYIPRAVEQVLAP